VEPEVVVQGRVPGSGQVPELLVEVLVPVQVLLPDPDTAAGPGTEAEPHPYRA